MHVLNLLPYGLLDYLDVDAIQRELHRKVAALEAPDTLIAWEARSVYTAGRRTEDSDIPDRSVPVIRMDRGGSVTYHGPGQLVVYPIVKVRPPKDVVAFVRGTELAIGRAMQAAFGVTTEQVAGRSGAWIRRPSEIDRKLCAIGIKFAADATMHGMALNVNTDLSKFHRVIACGLADADVASLEWLGVHTTLPQVAAALLPELARTYEQFLLRPSSPQPSTLQPSTLQPSMLQPSDKGAAGDSAGEWGVIANHEGPNAGGTFPLSKCSTSQDDAALVAETTSTAPAAGAPLTDLPELDAAEWLSRAPKLRAGQELSRHTGVAWEPKIKG